jgi:hypothetical protein
MNWTLLNKKVLKLIRCEVNDDEIEAFATRKSAAQVVDFLRLLRVRIPAYEPLYLSGQYSVDPVSQARLTAHLSSTHYKATPVENEGKLSQSQGSSKSSGSQSTTLRKQSLAPNSTQSFSTYSSQNSFNTTLNTTQSAEPPSRRPSMMKSQQLLKR